MPIEGLHSSAASAKHKRQQNNAIMMMILINPPRIVFVLSLVLVIEDLLDLMVMDAALAGRSKPTLHSDNLDAAAARSRYSSPNAL